MNGSVKDDFDYVGAEHAFATLIKFVTSRNVSNSSELMELKEANLRIAVVSMWDITEGRSLFNDIPLPANYKEADAFTSPEVDATINRLRLLAKTTVSMGDINLRLHGSRTQTSKLDTTYFAKMHKPASEGTVAELAAKYGKSKSEIRRLKAEGLLHTLTS